MPAGSLSILLPSPRPKPISLPPFSSPCPYPFSFSSYLRPFLSSHVCIYSHDSLLPSPSLHCRFSPSMDSLAHSLFNRLSLSRDVSAAACSQPLPGNRDFPSPRRRSNINRELPPHETRPDVTTYIPLCVPRVIEIPACGRARRQPRRAATTDRAAFSPFVLHTLSLSHLFSISVSIYTFLSSSLTLSCSSYLFPPLSPRFSPPSSRVSLFFNLFSRYILFCSFLRFFQSLDLYTSHPRFFFPSSSGFTLFPAHDSSYRARKTRFRSQKHFVSSRETGSPK